MKEMVSIFMMKTKKILARLEYKRNDNVLIFDHTVVSDKLKDKGLLKKLFR